MITSRRNFLLGGGATLFAAGCRQPAILDTADLRFGVVSDIHITTPESAAMFRRALEYFRKRGVDAVMIPGDLTDWGIRSGFTYVHEAWEEVFGGTDVVPLFCTGNHDFDGWWYGDMTEEMRANGYSEQDAITKYGMKQCWESAFNEPYAPLRLRKVKGYSFVSCEFKYNEQEFAQFFKENDPELRGDKPFFFFQHMPIGGTAIDGGTKVGFVKRQLDAYQNCIAFTGHTHQPFYDERLIWQGEFTSISTPSLSYSCSFGGYENGNARRFGKCTFAMPDLPNRMELNDGMCFVVNVNAGEVVVERIDVAEGGKEVAAPWVLPLPLGVLKKPYLLAPRAAASAAPRFPSDAQVEVVTRNGDDRSNHWTIKFQLDFPSAECPGEERVYDYLVTARALDGSAVVTKKYLTPSYSKPRYREPDCQRIFLNVRDVPQDKDYRIEIVARNCFGKVSNKICSRTLHSVPGFGKADKHMFDKKGAKK